MNAREQCASFHSNNFGNLAIRPNSSEGGKRGNSRFDWAGGSNPVKTSKADGSAIWLP